jgi:hypothetical protein
MKYSMSPRLPISGAQLSNSMAQLAVNSAIGPAPAHRSAGRPAVRSALAAHGVADQHGGHERADQCEQVQHAAAPAAEHAQGVARLAGADHAAEAAAQVFAHAPAQQVEAGQREQQGRLHGAAQRQRGTGVAHARAADRHQV